MPTSAATGHYIERQIARWGKQYQSAGTERIAAMDRLIEWLPAHLPPSDETAIVHGDYRLDNVIFHPTEPRILAVLDWELVDARPSAVRLRLPGDGLAPHAAAVPRPQGRRRRRARHSFRAGLRRRVLRTHRRGRASTNWEFYLIFNMFRLAAILHGVLARAIQGNAASSDAVETGRRARLIADVAWDMAQRQEA